MAAAKPNRAQYAWKYADKRMDVFTKSLLKWLDNASDSNPALEGIQNPFELTDIPFRADCPGIDVFAIGIFPSGGSLSPGFWRSTLDFIIKETGGVDSSQKTFDILAPPKSADLVIGDHIEGPSGEIMRVEGISIGSPNWTITVERGAHGTDSAGAAHDEKLRLLTPRVGMKRIVLAGDTSALDPPVLNAPNGVGDGILLTWTHSYSAADLVRLKGWRIYYSDSAGIDLEDEESYNGYLEIEGIDKHAIFNPIKSGFVDVDQAYYFAMTALTKSLLESELSNEVSGKVYSSIGPNPNGPLTPAVVLNVTGKYRLRAEARKPTDINAALGVANAAQVSFELYYAAAGEGNPTTGTPDGNQTLVGSFNDTAVPYQYEKAVDGHGFGEYWARAKVTDGADQVGSWGLSSILTLDDESSTTDTGVPTGVFLNVIVKTRKAIPGGGVEAQIIHGVAASGNYDSADVCEISYRLNGSGAFSPSTDDPWPEDTNYTRKYGSYPAVDTWWYANYSIAEITCRIHNAYGWTHWITPEKISFQGVEIDQDSGVCDLAAFGAWTQNSPPLGGWSANIPEPTGEQVTFDYVLGTVNRSTVHELIIAGTKQATIPAETVQKSEGDGTLTAVPGSVSVTVSGFSATENQFADKFLKIGRAPGANPYDTLQVFHISSNTAGNPFTLTLSGDDKVRNIDPEGSVSRWSIIDKPIWSLCDYYRVFPIRAEYFGAIPPQSNVFRANATGMKFWAWTNNGYGWGNERYADGTATGTAEAGSATYREIGGVDTPDLKDGAVITSKLGNKAVTPEKTEDALIPIAHSLAFTPTSNKAFSWSSGTVEFQGGVSKNLGSGDSGNLSTNANYWVSFLPSSPGGGLTITTSIATALAGGKVLLAQVHTTGVTTEYCSIISRWGAGSHFGAASISCGKLSAFSVDAGEITAGILTGLTIRTSPNAETSGGIEIDSTDGFRNIDFSGTTRVQIPANSSKIVLMSGYNVTSGLPETGWIEFASNFHIIGGVGILPDTSGSGNFLIGSSGGLHTYRPFHSIELVADNDLTLELRTSSTFVAAVALSSSSGLELTTGSSKNITLAPGMSGNLIISGSGGNNIALDSNGNLELAGDLKLKDKIEFTGSGTSFLKMKNSSGGTGYLYLDGSNNPTGSSSAP